MTSPELPLAGPMPDMRGDIFYPGVGFAGNTDNMRASQLNVMDEQPMVRANVSREFPARPAPGLGGSKAGGSFMPEDPNWPHTVPIGESPAGRAWEGFTNWRDQNVKENVPTDMFGQPYPPPAEELMGNTPAPKNTGMDVNDPASLLPPVAPVDPLADPLADPNAPPASQPPGGGGGGGNSMSASLAAFGQQANALNDDIGKEFAKDKWMALAQAGFAMLAEPGTLAEGIGRGGQAGLAYLGQARDKRDEAQRYADEKGLAQQALALKAAQASRSGAAGGKPWTAAGGDLTFLKGMVDSITEEINNLVGMGDPADMSPEERQRLNGLLQNRDQYTYAMQQAMASRNLFLPPMSGNATVRTPSAINAG